MNRRSLLQSAIALVGASVLPRATRAKAQPVAVGHDAGFDPPIRIRPSDDVVFGNWDELICAEWGAALSTKLDRELLLGHRAVPFGASR